MQREVVVVVVPWCWPGRAADDVRLRRYGPGIRGTCHLSPHVWTGAWIIELTTVTRTLSDATTTGSVKLSLLKGTRQCPSHSDVRQAIVLLPDPSSFEECAPQ